MKVNPCSSKQIVEHAVPVMEIEEMVRNKSKEHQYFSSRVPNQCPFGQTTMTAQMIQENKWK